MVEVFAMFVASAKPGDHVEIKNVRIGGMTANAETVK